MLKAEGAEAIEISEVTVTADGLTFTLPTDCPEGEIYRKSGSWSQFLEIGECCAEGAKGYESKIY